MKYYVRPATKKTNLLLIATSELGTVMIEQSQPGKVLAQYSAVQAHLPEGVIETSIDTYMTYHDQIMQPVAPVVSQLMQAKAYFLFPTVAQHMVDPEMLVPIRNSFISDIF